MLKFQNENHKNHTYTADNILPQVTNGRAVRSLAEDPLSTEPPMIPHSVSAATKYKNHQKTPPEPSGDYPRCPGMVPEVVGAL